MAFDAKPSASWGGARLKSDRVSSALTLKQAERLIAAAHCAESLGLPFNRHVTFHWGKAGIQDGEAARAIGQLVKLASDWLRTNGVRPVWAWVRENDSGDGSKGSHVHILLHCPATVPIGSMWRRWLKRITGHAYRRGTVHTSRIGGSLNTYATFPTVYRANLDRVLAYLCKGVRPEVGATLGLPRTEPSGLVIGKRAAICQFLRQGLSVMKLGVCNFVAETRSHAEVKSIEATKQH